MVAPASPAPYHPSVVVHIFAYAVGPGREAAQRYLAAVWSACAERLATTEPVPGSSVGIGFPADLDPHTGVVAHAHDPAGPGPRFRAEVRLSVDGTTATLAIALDEDWPTGRDRWHEIATAAATHANPDDVVGTAVVLLATVPAGTPRDATDRAVIAAAAAVAGTGWRVGPAAGPRDGARLAEILPEVPDDGRAVRWIAAITAEGSAGSRMPDLRTWVWDRSPTGPAVLVSYLLLAARLRSEWRVWRHANGFGADIEEVDDAVRELMTILATPAAPSEKELDGQERRVAAAQQRRAGLVTVTTRLRQMRDLANSTHAYLAALITAPGGLFDDDARVADQFAVTLARDASRIDAVRERALEVDTLAAAAVQRRQLASQEEAARRRERFNFLQAAIIGAVLLALAAFQSFKLDTGLQPPANIAITVALTALAIWLSAFVVLLALTSRLLGAAVVVISTGVLVAATVAAVVTIGADPAAPGAAALTTTTGEGFVVGAVLAAAGFALGAIRRRRSSNSTTAKERQDGGVSGG